nr:retrovirus-related Pol polyprotein from transposon TNT 1-94 [Tanacetum cinerariifolium]
MFEIKTNQILNENERLLEQVINKDIVIIVVNSSVVNASVNMHECKKCLKLETGLLKKKDFVEKETYDKLFRCYTTLEKHCISLEVDTQLNQENFQMDNSISNESTPRFDQYYKLNELKAQPQKKNMVINKLKERIKSSSGNMNKDKVKKDIEVIETINIELGHRESKLIAKNKYLKQTYKKLYDSIKPEKGLIIAALRDELRKLKGKAVVNNVVTSHTIAPEMLMINVEPIAPKLLRNGTVHSNYLSQSMRRNIAKPTEKHLKEVKRIFRYLRGTVNTGLWYTKDSFFELTGFSDADYAGCKDTFKSTSSGAQFLEEKLVSWSSNKQDCTALSTAKAEYVSLSACSISCNPVQHSRTKHIAVRYHFIKEHVEKGTIELYFVKTDYQLADIFIKALLADHFNYLVRRLGMRSLSPKELECLPKSQ